MKNDPEINDVVRIRGVNFPFAVGIFVSLIGLIIISEWTFGIKLVARFSPTDSSMKINTSIIFLLFGLSLVLLQLKNDSAHKIAKTLTVFGLLISAATLSQYIFGFDLGIDEIIFRDNPNPDITSSPGRMSPLVAANFLLSGTALLFWRSVSGKGLRPAEYFGLLGLFIPFIVTLGYLFSASSLYSFSTVTGVALITAILFLILHTGILAVRSKHGITTVLLSETRGGSVLRFLLPSSLGALILLDWLWVKATQAGLLAENLVVPLGAISSGMVITFLIWRTAKLLYEADIKEKLSYQELQQAHKIAEEANRSKDQFISIVSHELRTPLSAVLGWIRIVEKNPTEENMRRAFEVISRQSESQLKLVEDLLDNSRIISGKMRLEISLLEIETLINEALESIRPAAEAKNIKLAIEKSSDSINLHCDGDRLQQVFWNLLSNAVKFTPNDGTIKIHLNQNKSDVEIKIADTGDGIETDFLPFVFDRFRQAANSTSKRTGGLGLGLSLVKNIVELHGGKVSAHSDGHGKGSIFTIILPIRKSI